MPVDVFAHVLALQISQPHPTYRSASQVGGSKARSAPRVGGRFCHSATATAREFVNWAGVRSCSKHRVIYTPPLCPTAFLKRWCEGKCSAAIRFAWLAEKTSAFAQIWLTTPGDVNLILVPGDRGCSSRAQATDLSMRAVIRAARRCISARSANVFGGWPTDVPQRAQPDRFITTLLAGSPTPRGRKVTR